MFVNPLLVIILSVSGVLSQRGWGVTYTPERICALKGSSVHMSCTYSYPTSYTVQKTFWFISVWNSKQGKDLSQRTEYSHRVEYLGNQNNDCTFRINQLKESDSGTYKFRFLTDRDEYTGDPGVILKVTDLRLTVNPVSVIEGERVSLICRTTTCVLTGSPAYIWYRDGSPLSNTYQQFKANMDDAGSYTCALKAYQHLPSPAVALNVRYSPKNILVSVSPSGEIVEGSSVTLTCSSVANPPVRRYTFRKTGAEYSQRGTGRSYTIKHIKLQDAGEYYCEAENSVGTNRSPRKRLDVRYATKNTSVSVSPSGEIVEGSSVTLTCRSDANPPVQRYTWFNNNRAVSSETEGQENSYTIKNITLQDAGEYYCEAENAIETNRSPPKHLDVQYAPKKTSVSVNPSDEIVEGSSVTLTCSSDVNPPVQSYTWFKNNDTGVWQAGSGQSLNFSNFRSWNSGQYYCESQNSHGAQNASALLVTAQGGQSLIVAAAVGVVAILALVFLGVLCVRIIRRRKSTNETEGGRQGSINPIYDNVSGMAMSRTGTQGTDRDDGEIPLYSTVQPAGTPNQEQVLYSTVQPASTPNQEQVLYSTVQNPLPQSEDGVQYASIKLPPSSAAPRSLGPYVKEDCVLYNTLGKQDM